MSERPFPGTFFTEEKKTLHAAEQHREDVVLEREEWKKLQEVVDVERLVFLDETWTKTNMTPLYGRAEIGKRVVDFVPHGHWKTTTFLAALRHDGLTAPMVVDGAINGELFLAYVQQILLPTLKPGDIVDGQFIVTQCIGRGGGGGVGGRDGIVFAAIQSGL